MKEPNLDPPEDRDGGWKSDCCEAPPMGTVYVPGRSESARAREEGIDLEPEGRCSKCRRATTFTWDE